MPLQIFVEDELAEAYEVLALRALGFPPEIRNRRAVRAARINVEDLTTLEGLLDLTRRAMRSGHDTILFILDEEEPTSGRPPKLASFRQAFLELCTYLASGREKDLGKAKVIRIVCKRCLESWLIADPQAIVDSVRGRHGIEYFPAPQRTEELLPIHASERIAHVIRETGRRLGRRDLIQTSSKGIKSRGASIAGHVVPDRARPYNVSLNYFYDMIDGQRSGCDHPCPE
ncbi:MAG: hypothetical protein WAM82_11890 [Thermoanaerobaculia bacterium]